VLNALEAIRLHAGADVQAVRFHQACDLGDVRQGAAGAQTESTLRWPRSPYGVAKVFGRAYALADR